MNKSLILLALCIILSTMIHGQVNPIPISVAFSLDEKDLIPEGITYDSQTRQFFLSSIYKEKVVAISENGAVSDFIRSKQDSIFESLGMKVDVKNRRLWVLSNKDIEKGHLSAVHVFNIDSKSLIKKFILLKDEQQLFNDLVLTKEGGAYITDTYASRIYTIPSDLSKLELLLESDSLLKWANGIAISPDNKILFVASGRHITIIDLLTKEMQPIVNPNGIDNFGIDGLVFYKNGLLAVVNGVTSENEIHIARYLLSTNLKEIMESSIIDKGNPLFNIPTTCVMVDDDLYCLANTCLNVLNQKQMKDLEKLQPPMVLKYILKE